MSNKKKKKSIHYIPDSDKRHLISQMKLYTLTVYIAPSAFGRRCLQWNEKLVQEMWTSTLGMEAISQVTG